MNTQQSLVDAAMDARRRGAVEPIDAWFADDLDEVDQALGFAAHVLEVMEVRHFAEYELVSAYTEAFEEFFTTEGPEPVGQSRLKHYGGEP